MMTPLNIVGKVFFANVDIYALYVYVKFCGPACPVKLHGEENITPLTILSDEYPQSLYFLL